MMDEIVDVLGYLIERATLSDFYVWLSDKKNTERYLYAGSVDDPCANPIALFFTTRIGAPPYARLIETRLDEPEQEATYYIALGPTEEQDFDPATNTILMPWRNCWQMSAERPLPDWAREYLHLIQARCTGDNITFPKARRLCEELIHVGG